ncbi:hypothetical protein [Asanoa iriomotensis]|uniref:LexA-binding, inner membrane-associated hydrolase n=1 Tax=Asanoa iriomotensis TaxID=234613 RepID=A0ABQ4BW01_9ACTN|nr:hypothetical protein [Asanoa iriomotensis]GIF54712.1 hypothetical protein Air01nite_08070 [Asanoa iriomotensis]
MTPTTIQENPSLLRWVAHRWPTFAAIPVVAASLFGLADVRGLAFLLVLSPLGYLVPASVNRPGITWPAVLIGSVAIAPFKILGLNPAYALLVASAVFVVIGTVRRAPGFGVQAIAAVLFALLAVVAIEGESLVLGGVLISLGLLAHAAWDVYHHRLNRVVPRSFAEWCAVLDVIVGVAALVLIF